MKINQLSLGDKIAQEEIFGPVVAVIKFKDEEEAIEIANSTSVSLCFEHCSLQLTIFSQYGLAAGVHSLSKSI